MSRLSVLAAQPRVALGALLTLLLAAAAVVGSGANFSASSANPANTFASGTLSIDNSAEGVALFTASGMKPGGTPEVGTVDIENDGSLPGVFTLSRTAPANSGSVLPLSNKLNVKVVDCGTFTSGSPTCDAGDTEVYSGTLTAMGITTLGNFAANEKRRYQFTVQLDTTADNDYQGGSSTVKFDWNAVQS